VQRHLTSGLLSVVLIPLAIIYGLILVLACAPVHLYYVLKNRRKGTTKNPPIDHPTSWRW